MGFFHAKQHYGLIGHWTFQLVCQEYHECSGYKQAEIGKFYYVETF